MPLLSIVVPFHNSHAKSRRLIATLSGLKGEDVELIFVDDGSTEDEADLLALDVAAMQLDTRHIRQENKGPGGARNTGLAQARGQYVWFVDSDDDINPEAIEELRRLAGLQYDFIDFDIAHETRGVTNSMRANAGENLVTRPDRKALLRQFGRLCTKIFRREFLVTNWVRYPEYCVYEDNTLALIFPFLVSKFYKSEVCGYTHHTDGHSVTRVKSFISLKYYDRLETAILGLDAALSKDPTETELPILLSKFQGTFLLSTVHHIFDRGADLDRASRVARYYQDVLKLRNQPAERPEPSLTTDERSVFLQSAWDLSAELPDQSAHFAEIKRAAWGRKSVNLPDGSAQSSEPKPLRWMRSLVGR